MSNNTNPRNHRVWMWGAAVGGVAGMVGWLVLALSRTPEVEAVEKHPQYVGSSSCIDCHREQFELFRNSHHDRAMEVATEDTVLGRFDGSQFESQGILSTFFRDGERFMVRTEGTAGQLQDYQVKWVFGCDPIQQYMAEVQPPSQQEALGQIQVLRLAWDVADKKWMNIPPPDVADRLEPEDPLHWTGITQRWNSNCAPCHSTNLQTGFDPITNSYATTFSEIDVSCEACHGPGSRHIEIVNATGRWGRLSETGLVNLKTGRSGTQIETCAPCHSRRREIWPGFRPGEKYTDYFACQLISSQIYHHDGQVREEDYVYGSFIQSRMYHQGIKCTDCHDPHSTRVKFNDNRLCTSCHQHPAGKYDSPAHHHHQPGSSGARCVECHMPATTYMEIDPRRDHSLRVPRPDLSVSYGSPNACTSCHHDPERISENDRRGAKQYLHVMRAAEAGDAAARERLNEVDAAMAAAFANWYPDATSRPDRSTYYERLLIGKSDIDKNGKWLSELAVDRSAPAIFRASALETLNAEGMTVNDSVCQQALRDPEPIVVAEAVNGLQQSIIEQLSRLADSTSSESAREIIRHALGSIDSVLDHQSRRVRIEAARAIGDLPLAIRSGFAGSFSRTAFDAALNEYKTSLRVANDRAASLATLAQIHENDEEFERAEDLYRLAIGVEPNFAGPRANLASLLEQRADQIRSQLIQKSRAADVLRMRERIDNLLAEAHRLRTEEHHILRQEVSRSVDSAGIHRLYWRFGLSSYLLKKYGQAEKFLLKAYQASPATVDYCLALATFYLQQSRLDESLRYAEALIELAPDNQSFRTLRDEILAAQSR